MADNNAVKPAAPGIPTLEVKGPKKERRGAGIPWFPNFAVIQGKGVGVHVLALLASKFGMIAALGSIALGSAAVGVTMRNDDVAKRRANAKQLTGQMKQDAAQSLANQPVDASAGNSMDGMAYIKGTGAGSGDGAAAGDGANGSGSAAGGAGAAGGDGAGGGGGMGMQAAGVGRTSGIRDGVDASVRQGMVGKAQADKMAARGRRTAGLDKSKSMGRLLSMGPGMQGNRTGYEAAASGQTAQWEGQKANNAQLSGPAAGVPGAQTGGTNNAGITPGEGGPSFGGGAPNSGGGSNVPDIPEYEDVTPYAWAINIAKMLMILATVLAIVSAIIKKWGGPTALGLLPTIQGITAAIGGILALLGCYMLAMGQMWQGTIWTTVGAVIGVVALSNMDDTGWSAKTEWAKIAADSAHKTLTPALLEGGLAAGGFAGEEMMRSNKTGLYDDSQHKKDYEEYYGVDPDTGKVSDENKALFDEKYGEGAADDWNKKNGGFKTG